MRRHIIVFALAACLSVQIANAQNKTSTSPAGPRCEGDPTIVRISKITPTGTMEGFMKAVEAHLAWYRSHGYKDNLIYAAKIMTQDPVTNAMKYSDTEVMTFHVRPPEDAR